MAGETLTDHLDTNFAILVGTLVLLRAEYLMPAIACNTGFFSVYLLCLCKNCSFTKYLLATGKVGTSTLQLRHGSNGWPDEPFLLSLITQEALFFDDYLLKLKTPRYKISNSCKRPEMVSTRKIGLFNRYTNSA